MKRPTITDFEMPDIDNYKGTKPNFSTIIEPQKEPNKKGQKVSMHIKINQKNAVKIKDYCKRNNITISELLDTYITNLK